MLGRIFGRTPDPLAKQASSLVGAANVFGIGFFTKVGERFPMALEFDLDQWDWVFTIGGVLIAATRLEASPISASRKKLLMSVVAQDLAEWKPDGIAGFEDCKAMFEQTYDLLASLPEYQGNPEFLAPDAVGTWMAWNLLGHGPNSSEERQLTRVIGIAVTTPFFDWWADS